MHENKSVIITVVVSVLLVGVVLVLGARPTPEVAPPIKSVVDMGLSPAAKDGPKVEAPQTTVLDRAITADSIIIAKIKLPAEAAGELSGGSHWVLELIAGGENSLFLERLGSKYWLVEILGAEKTILAEAVNTVAINGTESITATVQNRRVTVWLDGNVLFKEAFQIPLRGRVEFVAYGGVSLLSLDLTSPREPNFSDSFARGEVGADWKVLSGNWDIAGINNAERSSNAFAMRASFKGGEIIDSWLKARPRALEYGVGAHFSNWHGALTVDRITASGSAYKAGLAEHDIILGINGRELRGGYYQLRSLIRGKKEFSVTVLRPGEDKPRTFTMKPTQFRWGDESYSKPLVDDNAGASSRNDKVNQPYALLATGRMNWRDYSFATSMMCEDQGAMGLAFGVFDEKNFHALLILRRGTEQTLRVVRVRSGVAKVLAETEFITTRGSYYRMSLSVENSQIVGDVDGTEITCLDEELMPGRAGLYAELGNDVYFDDVAIFANRADTVSRLSARSGEVISKEQDMQSWAAPKQDWRIESLETITDEEFYWNNYRFSGDVSLRFDGEKHDTELLLGSGAPDRALLKSKDGLGAVGDGSGAVGDGSGAVGDGSGAVGDGLGAVGDGPGAVKIVGRSITALGKTYELPKEQPMVLKYLASGKLEFGEQSLMLGRRGDYLALKNLDKTLDGFVVSSSGVQDYFFRRAPIDWAVGSGRFSVRNKWICDPRFSWFGGHSENAAAIWHKKSSGGEVSFDVFTSLLMRYDEKPYERVGDFGISILCEAGDFTSGYLAVLSGGRNEWTRLYRAGELIAESRRVADRMPSNVIDRPIRRDLHQRWFGLSLERTGGRVRFALDGRVIFDEPDTLGRETGHAAVLTFDNGILVGRARVSASVLGTNASLRLSEPAPERVMGFSNEVFLNRWADIESKLIDGKETLVVGNARSGGAFATSFVKPISANDVIEFEFKAEPGSKVNLYLQSREVIDPVARGPLEVRLTGTGSGYEYAVPLTSPLARDDGNWHRVRVDIALLLREANRQRVGDIISVPSSSQLIFGSLGHGVGSEYLPAGIGGNKIGARYYIRNFRIIENSSDSSAPRLKSVSLGDDYILRAQFEDKFTAEEGAWVGGLPTGSGLKFEALELEIASEGASKPHLLTGRDERAQAFNHATQTLFIDFAKLGIKNPAGITFKNISDYAGRVAPSEKKHSVDLSGWRARPRVVSAEILPRISGEMFYDFEDEVSPLINYFSASNYYHTENRIVKRGEDNHALRVVASRASSSLMTQLLYEKTSLAPNIYVSFDYRINDQTPLNFYLRGNRRTHSILFTDTGDPMCENTSNANPIGRAKTPIADNKWHHAEIALSDLVQNTFWRSGEQWTRSLALMDKGWRGVWAGDYYELDNLRVKSVRNIDGLAARILAYSERDAVSVIWSIDGQKDSVPSVGAGFDSGRAECTRKGAYHEVEIALKAVGDRAASRLYLHFVLVDSDGKKSAVMHRDFLFDNAPPVVRLLNRAKERASTLITFDVREDSGLKFSAMDVKLRVMTAEEIEAEKLETEKLETEAEEEKQANAAEVKVKAPKPFKRVNKNWIRLKAMDGGYRITVDPRIYYRDIKDGSTVECVLSNLFDSVGNRAEDVGCKFIFTPSLDTTPPPKPRVYVSTCRTPSSYYNSITGDEGNNFEALLLPNEATYGCEMKRSKAAARWGEYGAEIKVLPNRGGRFSCKLRHRYFRWQSLPLMAFNYRLRSGELKDMAIVINLLNSTLRIPLSGTDASGKMILDGKWHRQVIDLRSFIESANPKLPRYKNKPIELAGFIHLVGRGSVGALLDIDELEMMNGSLRNLTARLVLAENIDDARYASYTWSLEADTVVENKSLARINSNGRLSIRLPNRLTKRFIYLHIKLRDEAGNWSETLHKRIELR